MKFQICFCTMSKISIIVTFLLLFEDVFCISGSFYADNGRHQTVLYQPLQKNMKNALRQDILHLLGLENRPKKRNIKNKYDTHKSSAEKFLLDIYENIEKSETDICRNNTCQFLNKIDFIVTFPNKVHHPQYPHFRHGRRYIGSRFYFDVSKIPPEEEIVSAELRLYRNVSQAKHQNQMNKKYKYVLYLFAVSEDKNANTLELVDQHVISSTDNGWLVLNVTAPLMTWIAFPAKNLGLYMKIKSLTKSQTYSVDPQDIGILSSTAPDEYKAFMAAYFKTSSQNVRVRTTRATRKKQQESYYDHDGYNPYAGSGLQDRYNRKRSCERWTLYVSFRDLGFEDWIIAPAGYSAFFCEGSCNFPLNAHMNATNHAIVQTLMHLMEPSAVPKPCCAPTQLSAITVLYFDDNSNVILKKYRNMVVKSCGCH